MNINKIFMLCSGIIFTHPTFAMNALKKTQLDIAAQQLQDIPLENPHLSTKIELLSLRTAMLYKLGARPVIILFDPQNTEGHDLIASREPGRVSAAIMYNLLHALKQACAPIIVHRSVWNNITYAQATSNPIIPKDFNFNPDEWYIRCSQDTAMMVFIPKKVPKNVTFLQKLESITIHGQKVNASKNQIPLSDGELLLGMKLNQLQKVDDPFAIIHPPAKTNITDYLLKIFVTAKDLRERNISDEVLNYWDIYLAGHGSAQYIAGMPVASFMQMLDFLNISIRTRSFFYVSCHSGAHLEKPYQFVRKKQTQEEDFNFLAITASIFNLPVGAAITNNSFENYFDHINEYFTGISPAAKSKAPNYKPLIEAIDSFKILQVAKQNNLQLTQYPAIRFPHAARWFTIPVENQATFILNDSAIIRTINGKKNEIVIPEKYTAIIVESRYIPISLNIKGTSMPLLKLQKVNETPYFFGEIHAADCTLDAFNDMLTTLKSRIPTIGKLYIETLILNNLRYKNVIIEPTVSFQISKTGNPSSPFVKDFNTTKVEIRNVSKLPESMKFDIPKPMIEMVSRAAGSGKLKLKGNIPLE